MTGTDREKDWAPAWAPDGSAIAFLSQRSGFSELWLIRPDGQGMRQLTHLHRDVVQTVTSGASLFAVFRSTYSDDVDAAEVGRYQLDTTATWFDRAIRARDAQPRLAVHDVAFTELVADPIATARAICRVADVAWSDATETALRVRLGELQEQHGAHRYTPQDFGLDAEEIRERFAGYRSRFGLP